METKPRQAYTGHFPADQLLERARMKAERSGRLQYVADGRISLKPFAHGSFICMGAQDWAGVINGRWIRKVYA